ncbi:TetR/AcrR family transcriptional regulator [Temperatibacter marinus]|uniref:TetR/AcrR family transcriptional regulator n=1 Tax=Temperatibacter marinus TaxID=1456591 RepID=A0AA52EBV5_9PROT|nr:TetR/AcrR family transcriptional regulator [Temperatibacter marinus]WND01860.1 TetR/AcrR family transcriptional regulator [Temperatibacter marinus]
MARPSRKAERRMQILDAYGLCLSEYGVKGATLEKVSEKAGLARALIRHNVGNREQLFDAYIEYFIGQSTDALDQLYKALPATERLKALVAYLFDVSISDRQITQISFALLIQASHEPYLARIMNDWSDSFLNLLKKVIQEDYPNAQNSLIETIAYGIMSLSYNVDSTALTGIQSSARIASHAAATLLIAELDRSNPDS